MWQLSKKRILSNPVFLLHLRLLLFVLLHFTSCTSSSFFVLLLFVNLLSTLLFLLEFFDSSFNSAPSSSSWIAEEPPHPVPIVLSLERCFVFLLDTRGEWRLSPGGMSITLLHGVRGVMRV